MGLCDLRHSKIASDAVIKCDANAKFSDLPNTTWRCELGFHFKWPKGEYQVLLEFFFMFEQLVCFITAHEAHHLWLISGLQQDLRKVV